MRKKVVFFGIVFAIGLFLAACSKAEQGKEPFIEVSNTDIKEIAVNAAKAKNEKKFLRQVTDMAGRVVELPVQIDKVYSTGQPGVVMLYTINPEKLLGWCLKFSDEAEEYIQPEYLSLPVLGLMQGGNNTANKEEIMGRRPDMILLMSTVDETQIASADKIQKVMQIPVVIADFSLENLPKTYRFLGELLGEVERCNILAEYCQRTLDEAKQNEDRLTDEDRLGAYYAQGAKGRRTTPGLSSHSEVINLVGADNVVKLDAVADGRLKVNMEQILAWNPEVILVADSMGHSTAAAGKVDFGGNAKASWQLVEAVKNQKVFEIPNYPFNWLDMPPSVNRIIGIKWLGNLLYPKYFSYDIKEEIKKYYELFYRQELSEEQVDKLLQNVL